jgi:hypothetical protein
MLDRFGNMEIALSAYNGGYRNQTINNPAYVTGVLERANYFAAQWNAAIPTPAPAPDANTPVTAEAGLSWWLIVGIGALIGMGVLFGGRQ